VAARADERERMKKYTGTAYNAHKLD